MAVFWLVLGVILLLIELRHLAFYALFGAVGSFGGGVTALVAPHAIPLQVAVVVAVAVGGVVAVRPPLSRAFPRRVGGHVARGVHGGLVGQEALTLDEVGSQHGRGHVQLAGERWLASSAGGVIIPSDTPVIVTAVEGTTLVVLPLGDLALGWKTGRELEADESGGPTHGGADGRSK